MLILSVAISIGGVAALLGWDVSTQIISSTVTGMVGIIVLRRIRGASVTKTPNQNLDIGQTVRVLTWNQDGTARVHYRGAEWDAAVEANAGDTPAEQKMPADVLYIKAVNGSKLILTSNKPSQ